MDWQNILFSILGTVLTALGSWIVSKLVSLINTKIKDAKLKGYLNLALNAVTNAVKATYQTYVENIKGTEFWTAEAQKKALNNAVNIIKAELGNDVKEFIENNFGDFEIWIKNQIEAALYNLKNSNSENKENEKS
jgi:hypothetical protein